MIQHAREARPRRFRALRGASASLKNSNIRESASAVLPDYGKPIHPNPLGAFKTRFIRHSIRMGRGSRVKVEAAAMEMEGDLEVVLIYDRLDAFPILLNPAIS